MVNVTENQFFKVAIGFGIEFGTKRDQYWLYWTKIRKWPLLTMVVVKNGQGDRISKFWRCHRIKHSIWRRISPRLFILNDFIKMTTLDHLSGQKWSKLQELWNSKGTIGFSGQNIVRKKPPYIYHGVLNFYVSHAKCGFELILLFHDMAAKKPIWCWLYHIYHIILTW